LLSKLSNIDASKIALTLHSKANMGWQVPLFLASLNDFTIPLGLGLLSAAKKSFFLLFPYKAMQQSSGLEAPIAMVTIFTTWRLSDG
jgi:hypothetical protein